MPFRRARGAEDQCTVTLPRSVAVGTASNAAPGWLSYTSAPLARPQMRMRSRSGLPSTALNRKPQLPAPLIVPALEFDFSRLQW